MNAKQMPQISQEQREQDERVSRNLDQLNEFIQAAIADASVLDEIPDGAMLIFEPVDDPAVMERVAQVAKREGRAVALVNLSRITAGATR